MNVANLMAIAEHYKDIDDMDVLDMHLKALSLQMCKIGRKKADTPVGYTCRYCNWCHVCSEINSYLGCLKYIKL